MYPKNDQQLSYETNDKVYYFSHGFDPLNNWSAHAVKIWDKTFPTVEHAFQYRKFSESAPKIARQILKAPSPWAAIKIDREHANQRQADWHEIKLSIMKEIIRAKVKQNEDVRQCLLSTKKKQIIENSPWDSFWGCGEDGKGQNQMGKILMEIRNQLTSDNPV